MPSLIPSPLDSGVQRRCLAGKVAFVEAGSTHDISDLFEAFNYIPAASSSTSRKLVSKTDFCIRHSNPHRKLSSGGTPPVKQSSDFGTRSPSNRSNQFLCRTGLSR
jgi:hypothetical protein